MFTLLLRPGLLLSICLLLPIALIRAQPYDDRAVPDLLALSGCTAPCFIGVHPGVTSVDDAFVKLNTHPWVAVVGADYRQFAESNQNSDLSTLRFVTGWQWSNVVPGWIDPNYRATLGVAGSQVTNLSFYTTLPLGVFVLAYGQPDTHALLNFGDGPADHYHIYRVYYRDLCMWVQASSSARVRDRYQWSAQIIYQARDSATGRCVGLNR